MSDKVDFATLNIELAKQNAGQTMPTTNAAFITFTTTEVEAMGVTIGDKLKLQFTGLANSGGFDTTNYFVTASGNTILMPTNAVYENSAQAWTKTISAMWVIEYTGKDVVILARATAANKNMCGVAILSRFFG